ncbi:hypothetical protein SteCoe_4696 [Stentor coeruleus]|uniref:RING-type E3 ubiquitin transferase n=1 Tax=Stentor coeruleus TaxID=5963 RepID=A0A1R2CU60_9CILI|nr:hypothetical protein SteCoe_4696 [Stentor coeruleus]
MNRIKIRDPSSQELKEQGNQFFMQKQYDDAIKCYTAAIKKTSTESILYSNRARCYYMIKDFDNVIKDASKAMFLDEKNLKAYLLYIRGLGNISKLYMSMTHVDIALKTCLKVNQIAKETSQLEFNSACKSLKKKLKVMIFLKNRENFNYKVSRLKSYYKGIIKNKKVNDMFNKYIQEKTQKNIPDTLCCPITLEMFKKPVITHCGNTYEAEALITHFTRMGAVDPINRSPINPYNIFKNDSILLAKKWFLKAEPWVKISETSITSLDIEF